MAVSKFRNQPVEIDGKRFASKKEGRRYELLKLLQRARQIDDLQCQVGYRLDLNGVHICRYVADFVYVDLTTSRIVVEDVKGVVTDVFRLKSRLMKAIHDIDVVTV